MKDLLNDTLNLDASPSYRLYRTARVIRSDLNRLLQSLEIAVTPEQWVLLFRLNEKDGQSQSEVSGRFFDDPPNITRILDALVKHRFVVRVPDGNDRRKFLIYLTHDGRKFIEKTQPLVIEKRKRVFRGFSASDIDQFIGYLNQVESNVLDDKQMAPASGDVSS